MGLAESGTKTYGRLGIEYIGPNTRLHSKAT